ncbi:ABC transporter permease [Halotalea alkalilenta]|uniref:Choline ABC transporter permease n=1 Tax=Halotalea alkalilenta TaxID=376489 RepID=A0A172YEF2_9GAMM|nr:ABC transporter permease [Halotalea alkalilenta]ANF57486.1 choline ABC transporter permease [Halotalea alkalilenta]
MDFTTTLANMDWQQVMLLTWQHVYLVGTAVGLAILIGVPLGVLMVRLRWLATPLLTVATIVITIPSIALFGIMLPIYSTFGMGLGAAPAITAVFLYSLLPILRNTYIALDGVDPGIREAGRGIGMTFWQRLWMVDLPLAVPVILGGVRTAVVMNIGVMTIAAVIGAGGLGLLILNGIGQSNVPLLVIGAIIVSLLAIVVDTLLNLLQRLLTSKGIEQ